MKLQLNVLLFALLCVPMCYCELINKIVDSTLGENSTLSKEVVKKLNKRQIPLTYDFGFMDYAAYDYYDWVCQNNACQVCDVLTGACCNPVVSANCFLPDSCANNPCLSGGTCVDTLTVAGNPDFVCVCIRGLTGKYCQLIDDFTPAVILPSVPLPVPKAPNAAANAPVQPSLNQYTNRGAQVAAGFANPLGSSNGAGGAPGATGGAAQQQQGFGAAGFGATRGLGAGLGATGQFGGMGALGGAMNQFGAGGMGAMGGLRNAMGGMGGLGGLGGGMGGLAGLGGGMGGLGGGFGGLGGGMNPTAFGGRKKREAEIAESLFKKSKSNS